MPNRRLGGGSVVSRLRNNLRSSINGAATRVERAQRGNIIGRVAGSIRRMTQRASP